MRLSDSERVNIHFHHWQFDVDVPRPLEGEARYNELRVAFERWYREMRIRRIGEGPSEVQRLIMARDLIGGSFH